MVVVVAIIFAAAGKKHRRRESGDTRACHCKEIHCAPETHARSLPLADNDDAGA